MRVKKNLIVSSRGQITLPADIRKRFGIEEGSVVTVEERKGEVILRPAAVLEIEMYSDAQIAEWEREDQMDNALREKLNKKLGLKRR